MQLRLAQAHDRQPRLGPFGYGLGQTNASGSGATAAAGNPPSAPRPGILKKSMSMDTISSSQSAAAARGVAAVQQSAEGSADAGGNFVAQQQQQPSFGQLSREGFRVGPNAGGLYIAQHPDALRETNGGGNERWALGLTQGNHTRPRMGSFNQRGQTLAGSIRNLNEKPKVSQRRGLTKPETDPRNWFLSSTRQQFNMQGKTRKEQEQWRSTPALPVANVGNAYSDNHALINTRNAGIDASFEETKRHIMDFSFRPYVRPGDGGGSEFARPGVDCGDAGGGMGQVGKKSYGR